LWFRNNHIKVLRHLAWLEKVKGGQEEIRVAISWRAALS
jgi:hypothetical protein